MKAIDYIKTKQRMCKEAVNCRSCPLNEINIDGECGQDANAEQAVEIVKKWGEENPVKTYLSVLLEKFPNAKLDDRGFPPTFCPHHVFNVESIKVRCKASDCIDCWNKEYKED